MHIHVRNPDETASSGPGLVALVQDGVDLPRVGRRSDGLPGGGAAPSPETRRGPAVNAQQVSEIAVAAKQASVEHLRGAAEELNKALRQSTRNLEFRLDEGTNRVVVKLTDTETGEVIRQIPSDEMLAISRAIGEFQQGLLLRQKA